MCQNLNIFVENIEISLYAQARQSLLLLTQGNIYNRLRFLNKYLMFLDELNELFREIRIRCWFLIDLTIKLMTIIKLLLDVSTLSSVIFKSFFFFCFEAGGHSRVQC